MYYLRPPGGSRLPAYAYVCTACGHRHEDWRSIRSPQPIACPECGEPYGQGYRQDFDACRVIGLVKGNPTTIGQLAEINSAKMGKEQLQLMAEADKAKKIPFTGKLPEGAKVYEKTGNAPIPFWRDGSLGGPVKEKPIDVSGKTPEQVQKYIHTGEL